MRIEKKKEKNTIKKKVLVKDSKSRTSTKDKKIKPKKAKRKFWKKLVTLILILGIIGILAVTTFLGYVVITSPKFDEKAFDVHDQTVLYDAKGEIIATIGAEKRESVTYDMLPQVLIDAIIATEDSRFFKHNGVDLPRFIKASIQQVLHISSAGGASTITMQVVKNNLTSTVSEGLDGIIRKFQDVYLSVFKVEKKYSKEEIIELYVNNYNLGSNIYGVGEASKYYFGKSVSELTLPEAALIAGLFQAPNRHNPYKNLESAVERRNTVLYLMQYHGYITEEEKELANAVTVESMLVGSNESSNYQGYIDTVADEIEALTGNNPYAVSMKVYTTMNRSIQNGINTVFNDGNKTYWVNDQVQAGVAVVDVNTGAIVAIGAGRNRNGERQFNYATRAYRQPGSTAKPIFAYGPGIEYNNFSSYTLFTDEPWAYSNGVTLNNWDGTYMGIITARDAVKISRNIPAVKAYQQVGTNNVATFAASLGLDVSLNQESENYHVYSTGVDNTVNEAYAIGGVAKGFTPLEMASAYASFASGGYYTEPYSVTKIEYRDSGEVVEFKPTRQRVMKDSTAYIMNNILESAVQSGFNGGALVYGSHVAAKTGTSNFPEEIMKKYNLPGDAVNDLWTVAYTPQYSIAVWYGYEKVSSTTYNTGGYPKEALTSAIMKYIPKNAEGWAMPSSVVAVTVEKETAPAKLPSAYTPSDYKTTEYFVKGTQPTEVSERFAQLSNVENLKSTVTGNTVTLSWSDYPTPTVYTDEYLKEYFGQSVFGNYSKKLIQQRKTFDEKYMGKVVFSIYEQEASGSLTLVGSTSNNTYTYIGNGNTTLVVKAELSVYKAMSSPGIKVTVNLGAASADQLIATLNGNAAASAKVGAYSDLGLKYIYYGPKDVLSTSTISYQLISGTVIKNYTSVTSLENAVNKLPAGNYKIVYVVSYSGIETSKTRSLTLTK